MLIQNLPIQAYLGYRSAKLRSKIAVKTDERVQLMKELISGIQVIFPHCAYLPLHQENTSWQKYPQCNYSSYFYIPADRKDVLVGNTFCINGFQGPSAGDQIDRLGIVPERILPEHYYVLRKSISVFHVVNICPDGGISHSQNHLRSCKFVQHAAIYLRYFFSASNHYDWRDGCFSAKIDGLFAVFTLFVN